VVALVHNNTKVGSCFRELDQGRLNLARKYNEAANGDSIITASLDGGYLRMCATAGTTLFPPHTRKVATAIAQHSCAISREPRPDQFTVFALFDPFTCFRINTFYQERIGPGMHTITGFTFTGHTRSKKFGHTKFIISSDMKVFLKL